MKAHMKSAYNYADCSYCVKLKVGCVIVKNNTPISNGYNGTPKGEDNTCEINGKTKSNVIHAEDNAFRKMMRSNESTEGCDLFITHSPCEDCSQRIIDAKISTVYFVDLYNENKPNGIKKLLQKNVSVIQMDLEKEELKKGTLFSGHLKFL